MTQDGVWDLGLHQNRPSQGKKSPLKSALESSRRMELKDALIGFLSDFLSMNFFEYPLSSGLGVGVYGVEGGRDRALCLSLDQFFKKCTCF